MPKLLHGKTAIITGASRGLGRAVATAMAIDGADVLLVGRDGAMLESVADDVRTAGTRVEMLPADVTEPDAAARIVRECIDRLGGVDILVNCAGVFVWRKFFDLTSDDWDKTLSTNLSATFFLTQAAAKAMVDRGKGGSIVNIASIHGAVGDPNVVAHCASKFGVVGLTKACAEAMRDYHVRVNAISPGQIDPDSVARRGESPGRRVTQADIATLCVYLGSDLARSVSGAVIEMYGNTHTVIKA